MADPAPVKLEFRAPRGNTRGSIRIFPGRTGKIFELSLKEATLRGEERVQLLEGSSYEYVLDVTEEGHQLLSDGKDGIVQPSDVNKNSGRLETGTHTGLLPII